MSENQNFNNWEEVIKGFINLREDLKIHDLLVKKDPKKADGDKKQAVIIQLMNALRNDPNINDDEIEEINKKKNTEKDKSFALEFQQSKYENLLALSSSLKVQDIDNAYKEKAGVIKDFHELKTWISYYSERASGVRFATHVAKMMHSSMKGVPPFFVERDQEVYEYISTGSLNFPAIDDAIDSAALTPTANFLKLKFNGNSLVSLVKKDSLDAFEFIQNTDLAEKWIKNFSQVFSVNEPKSHLLQKQVYFPVSVEPNEYHILPILKSSSMAHYIFEKIKYEKLNKLIYGEGFIKSFPNMTKLSLTGSSKAHTNVSPLHAKRSGEVRLFSTQPPTWQAQLKPPIYNQSLFEKCFSSNVKENVDYLHDFLLRFKSLELSIKNPKKLEHLDRWINNIIDDVFFYIASIQNLPAGWSSREGIKLVKAHQYLLDPFREDDEFKNQRALNDWQEIICTDFAKWLNRKLTGIDKQFTPQAMHTKMWKKRFKEPLRLDVESLNIVMKQEKVRVSS